MLKVKTDEIKRLVSTAVKGCSFNKILPITGFLHFMVNDGDLILETTDGTNQLQLTSAVEDEKEKIDIVVPADIMDKLINKITTPTISFGLKDGCLEVKGNGVYKIQYVVDENGESIEYPVFEINVKKAKATDLNFKDVPKVFNICKTAVYGVYDIPYLTGYYMKVDKLVTSDSMRICSVSQKFLEDVMLISQELADLLKLIDKEKVTVSREENKIVFEAEGITVSGYLMDEIGEYPIESIENYINNEMGLFFEVNKEEILGILDRMLLFTGAYDKNLSKFAVSNDNLQLTDLQKNVDESIKFKKKLKLKNSFDLYLDTEILKEQIEVMPNEDVQIFFDIEKKASAIKLVSGNVVCIIALLNNPDEVKTEEPKKEEN